MEIVGGMGTLSLLPLLHRRRRGKEYLPIPPRHLSFPHSRGSERMNISGHDIGVCTWSLQPQGMEDLVSKVKSLDLEHIQLGLLELVMLDDKRKHLELGHLRHSNLKITATMTSSPGEAYSSIATIRDTSG